MEKGTYATISANARVPLPAIELLRGLLSDDPEARWTPEQAEIWIDGRKNTPAQRKGQIKAKKTFVFQNRHHNNSRTLAYAFSLAPEEALRTVKSDGELVTWLKKSLEDKELSEKVKGQIDMVNRGATGVQNSPEMIIAKICIMLDPTGPIRYKRRSFMIESMGICLSYDVLKQQNPQDLLEVVTKDLYEVWLKFQTHSSPDFALWHRQYLRSKGYLKVNEVGFGFERCLYELNKRIPCLSPLIIDEMVMEIDDILPALDSVATTVDQETRPVDRHIAGFIGARFNEDIHPHLRATALPEKERSIIGTLSLLAFLQWKLKTPAVYGLASWLGGLLGSAINTYHNRKTRRDLEREIPQLVRKGSLPELFDLVDNAEQRTEDDSGFMEARKQYGEAETEINDIDGKDGTREQKLLISGQKAAAMFSIVIGMIIVSTLFLLNDWNSY